MSNKSSIKVFINNDIKRKFKALCSSKGLSMTDALEYMIKKVVRAVEQ